MPLHSQSQDTIVAQATPPGRGGVGIVRVSGPLAREVAQQVLDQVPKPRVATYLPFLAGDGQQLDQGLGIFFAGPNSFTGEDVLELQGHGGPVIIDMLIKRIRAIEGVRLARPGEFSERAFLNDKLDLAQAEAIADLIDATSEQAAKSALQSLQGKFSQQVHTLVESLTKVRMFVEAAIDFPEEEIDFLAESTVAQDTRDLLQQLVTIRAQARQGSIMREGMRVVLAGRPNAGKSSLLNALAGRDAAIVTEIAGTTRDVLREHIHIDGMPLHIIDTAGLRDASDQVEQIGIQRAFEEIAQADRVLFLIDSQQSNETDPHKIWPEFADRLPPHVGVTVIRNKADLSGETIGLSDSEYGPLFRLSAASGAGVDALQAHLKACMGFEGTTEGGFMARQRHLDALDTAEQHIQQGLDQLVEFAAGELLAEDLRQAQEALSSITGEFSSDDLLGRIFSSFCIGK